MTLIPEAEASSHPRAIPTGSTAPIAVEAGDGATLRPGDPGYRLEVWREFLRNWPEMLVGGLALVGFVYCLMVWAVVLS